MLANGLEVWIQLGPLRADEYEINVFGKKATCTIPSQINQRFSIHWRDHSKGPAFSGSSLVTVYIDNEEFDSGIITKSNPKGSSEGCHETADTVRPYMFEKIKTSYHGGRTKKLKDVGSIHVTLEKVKWKSFTAFAPQNSKSTNDIFSSQSTPADVEHVVGLAGVRKSRRVKRKVNFDHLHSKEQFTFIFNYRSPSVLQRNGVVTAQEAEALVARADMASQGNLKSEGTPQKRSFYDTFSEIEDLDDSEDELQVKVDKAITLLKEVKTGIRKRDKKAKASAKKRRVD